MDTMIQRLLILYALLLAAALPSAAADSDTTGIAERHALWTDTRTGQSGNPALMQSLYTHSRSEIAAAYSWASASRPVLYQMGDGHAFASVTADSYIRLSPTTSVWGEASYRTGRRRNITWCSTADFLLLYPHVMGDTLGGNLSSERYTFKGGWASRMGRLTLGAAADFRAEHEYRTTDPRPRCIATDLSIGLGATYALGHYTAGLNAGARFYKQTNNVKFYREAGIIPEYQMVGLGADYKRFSGSNSSAYYKATGWSAGLDLRPATASGAVLSASYTYTPYRRIMPNYNALPMTTLYVQRLLGEAGWRHTAARTRWSLTAVADYEHRAGDEHIAGNASASEYRVVATLTTYRNHTLTAYAQATAERTLPHGIAALRLRGGYTDFAADYLSPHREMAFAKAFGEAAAQWKHAFRHGQWLSADLSAAYRAGTSKHIAMPYATMDAAATRLADNTYAWLTADRLDIAAALRLDLPLRTRGIGGLFFRLSADYSSSPGYHATTLGASAGLSF